MNTLERLSAIEEIRSLQARYVRLADSKDWAGLGRLFLPDGSFIACDTAGMPQHVMKGAAEIASQIRASVGEGTVLHHLFSYEIDFPSPGQAHGVWAMEDWIDRSQDATVAPGAFRTMHGAGHYHIDYAYIDTSWSIAALTLARIKLEFTY
jgi:hypothetical protein